MSVIVERVEGKTLRVTAGNASTVVDGGADGFRSADLLLASLGSCMVGTMLTAAADAGIGVGDVRVELRPLVTLGPPERVSRIRMKMTLGGEFGEGELRALTAAAESCKVHNSLHHGIETQLDIIAGSPLAG